MLLGLNSFEILGCNRQSILGSVHSVAVQNIVGVLLGPFVSFDAEALNSTVSLSFFVVAYVESMSTNKYYSAIPQVGVVFLALLKKLGPFFGLHFYPRLEVSLWVEVAVFRGRAEL